MKPVLRRILLLTAAVYLILGLSPLALRFAVSGHAEPPPAASPSPAADESPDAVQTDTFRILDTGTGEILTVSDADFLRRLCRLFPDFHQIHTVPPPFVLSKQYSADWPSEKCQFYSDPNGQIFSLCEKARRSFRERSHSVQAMAMPAAIARA